MATGAGDGFLRPIFEGCISGYDHSVERRPYHRKCGCVLHSKSRKSSNTQKSPMMCDKVKYPIRRAFSEGNLALFASAHSSPSPSTSPAPLVGGVKSRRGSVDLGHDHMDEQLNNKTSGFV